MTARDVAQQLCTLIVQHNEASAAKLLTEDAQTSNTPGSIEAAVASMTSGATGSILIAQVVEEGIVEE